MVNLWDQSHLPATTIITIITTIIIQLILLVPTLRSYTLYRVKYPVTRIAFFFLPFRSSCVYSLCRGLLSLSLIRVFCMAFGFSCGRFLFLSCSHFVHYGYDALCLFFLECPIQPCPARDPTRQHFPLTDVGSGSTTVSLRLRIKGGHTTIYRLSRPSRSNTDRLCSTKDSCRRGYCLTRSSIWSEQIFVRMS